VASCTVVPRLDELKPRNLDQTSFLLAADGSVITPLHAGQDRVVLPPRGIPQELRDAVVAIEDRRFYLHHGVDPRAIVRAAYVNSQAGEIVEGGSTITQQLVRQLYLGTERTLRRKLDEAALAWQLEDRLTKRQILTRYLNTVYLGNGAYGVQAASRLYFGEDVRKLDLARSAMLAALIASPARFDPFTRPESARGRRNVVLSKMRQLGLSSGLEVKQAKSQPLGLDPEVQDVRFRYPYFVDYVKRWFLANPAFGQTRDERYELLFTGGLEITTTLSPSIQAAAESATRELLSSPRDPAAAITVLDPRTGHVRAMVGGRDRDWWRDRDGGQVNLATGAGGTGRQTGSAFKPFALVTALENGIDPSTVFPAPAALDVPLDNDRVWRVTNAQGIGYGSMSLHSATVSSVNTVYALLVQRLGAEKVVETATRMGLRCCMRVGNPTTPLQPFLSAVLGSNEANTLEMATAFGTLATGGLRVNPVPVLRVTDHHGRVLWEHAPKPRRVLDPRVASEATRVLQDAVRYGTGVAAILDGRPQFGKTGTAPDQADAWFVGGVPQLVASVWVGFPQGQIPMNPPRTRVPVYGGTWPAQLWRLVMERATERLPVREFPSAEVRFNLVSVDVTQDPLCRPNRFTLPQNIDYLRFIAGTEPDETCSTPTHAERVLVPSAIGQLQSAAQELLTQAGFFVQVRVEQSTQPPGTVIAQWPTPGGTALQASTVTITVARAPDESTP
jgi:penicillin-binding protein 1A